MIFCVTLNPCLDKTLSVPEWKPGDAVRGYAMREVVGGKGNNVARALTRLGRTARPLLFLGGAVGDHCRELLVQDDRLDPLVVGTAAPTRVILTVRTRNGPEQTAFFDPDPAVATIESAIMLQLLAAAVEGPSVEAVTLSGSSPSPATHALYKEMIGLCRTHRVPVFLDTYGAALDAIEDVWPDALQLNRNEAASYLRTPLDALNEAHVVRLLDAWASHGVACAVVTDGPRPVLARLDGRHYRAWPPAIEPVNPIGSGDSLLAGIADATLAGLSPEARLRRGVACAVANALVWDAAAIDLDQVRLWEAQVLVEAL